MYTYKFYRYICLPSKMNPLERAQKKARNKITKNDRCEFCSSGLVKKIRNC